MPSNQLFLFSSLPKIPQIEEWPRKDLLRFEKELLGLYVSAHPLSSYRNLASYLKVEKISSLYEENEEKDVRVLGVIEKIKIILTRKEKEKMAIVKVEDESQSIEVFVFPRLFQECISFLKEMKIVLIEGRLTSKEEIPKIIASRIIEIERIWQDVKALNITLHSRTDIKKLKEIFSTHRGSTPVIFTLKRENNFHLKIKTSHNFYLKVDDNLLKELTSLVGKENLSLTL